MAQETFFRYLEYFRHHAREPAYVHRRGLRTERWTYGQVLETAYRFARELESRGIGLGDHVLLWGDNCAEWVAAFLGAMMRGAIAVPMDRVAQTDFTLRVAQQVEARLCVCSRGLTASLVPFPTLSLEDLVPAVGRHSADECAEPGIGPDHPLQIVFTSGTTAEPKGVVITHRNVVANLVPFEPEIAKYRKYERVVHPIRFLNLLPLSHVFGQFLSLYIPPLLGGTVVFLDTLNPSEVISTIRRERISVLVAVPRLLESLRGKLEWDFEAAGKLDSLRRDLEEVKGRHFALRWWRFRKVHSLFGWKFWAIISGGATLDREAEEFWNRLSFVVIQGYGLTETTSLITVNHPFRLGRGSIGKVLPGRELRLDESGEILVRGDGVASGYYVGRELKPVTGQEGWFHTGDVGELDAEGNLYFKGRRKNVIVTSEGMNVYPEDLEAALRRQPEVRDCVVFGIIKDGNAEPCAVLLLSHHVADPEGIVRRANRELAEYQHIRRWFVWPDEDFPRTSTQKPRTNVIQESVRSRLGASAPVAVPEGSLAELVSRVTGRPLTAAAPGANLALSSIERVELMSAIEDRYQIDLNESRFSAATTLADLETMLREPGPRRSDYRFPRWPGHPLTRLVRVGAYYLMSWPAMMLMARPAVRGRENLLGVKGPVLIVSNHITQVDIGYIMAALPPSLRLRLAVAMWGELLESMRNPSKDLGWLRRRADRLSYSLLLALFNVFPLPQESGFRQSFAFAGECVDRGYSIVVFPEGLRSPDGRLYPFQTGVGILALNLGLPVVPVRIDGLYELKKAGRTFARPGSVRVTTGAARRFQPGSNPADIARELEAVIREMEWRAPARPRTP